MDRRGFLAGLLTTAAAGLAACGDAPPVFAAEKYQNIVVGEIPGKTNTKTGKAENFLIVTGQDATAKSVVLGYGRFSQYPVEHKDGSKSFNFVRLDGNTEVNAGSITLDASRSSAKIEIVYDKENASVATQDVIFSQTLTHARLHAFQNSSANQMAKPLAP